MGAWMEIEVEKHAGQSQEGRMYGNAGALPE